MSSKFEIVFRGKLADGFSVDQVKANLARLFKKQAADMDRLFDGKRVVLRRGLDQEAANHYRQVLKRAGVMCIARAESSTPTKLEPKADLESESATPDVSQTLAPNENVATELDSEGTEDGETSYELTLADPDSIFPQPEKVAPPVIPISDLELAALGAIFDSPTQFEIYPFDDLEFFLDPLGVEFDHWVAHAMPSFDIADFQLAEIGATVDQYYAVAAPVFNLGGLDFSTNDAPLAIAPKISPPQLDISDLTLVPTEDELQARKPLDDHSRAVFTIDDG